MTSPYRLLADHEPAPCTVINAQGRSPVFLVCEHAGKRLPERLGDLGLASTDRERHIAWDIGAEAVSRHLSKWLDAPLYAQIYSRLVCDCNRRTDVDSYIPVVSETTPIPGNLDLSPNARAARTDEVYWPFHKAVDAALDARQRGRFPTVFVTIHSFTPVFKGVARPMHVGLLFNRDRTLADLIGSELRRPGDIVVTDNEPYAMGDLTDFTVPYHGERRRLPHIEFEIRQDLIADPDGQEYWARRLFEAIEPAVAAVLREGAR